MSNEAIYGLLLLVAMVLALGGGIVLVNWLISKLRSASLKPRVTGSMIYD